MKLILASNSPRRKQILEENGFDFTVMVGNYSEKNASDPVDTAVKNAEGKARDVFDRIKDKKDCVVIGADTVVCYNGAQLGKPQSEADAVQTLKTLSGNVHTVVTGYAVVSENNTVTGSAATKVVFNELSSELIEEYVKSGLPMDKAGSYGLQDGFPIVKEIKGDRYNVIGLPLYKIEKYIKDFKKERN